MAEDKKTKAKSIHSSKQGATKNKDELIQTLTKKPRSQEAYSYANQMANVESGYNTRIVSKVMELYNLPRVKDEDELEERLQFYFDWCAANDMKPSVTMMAIACGVDRNTLYKWEVGMEGSTPRKRSAVKKAKAVLNGILEEYMMNGKVNPVTGIFMAKNHFGYRDQQEVVVAPAKPLGEETDTRVLAEKYANLPD